ncbi:hypothetical protein DFJ77DRAFT_443576 [Powellomyces hirtus]|nr:hypothetical protein DFJ77DRAFT_443576 [Powellomyces hirtus]
MPSPNRIDWLSCPPPPLHAEPSQAEMNANACASGSSPVEFSIVALAREHMSDPEIVYAIQCAAYPPRLHEAPHELLAHFDQPRAFGFLALATLSDAPNIQIPAGYIFGYPIDPSAPLPALHDTIEPSRIATNSSEYPAVVWLHECTILPRFHRQGIAKALVNHFLTHAALDGFARCWGGTVDTEATRIWLRLGFAKAEDAGDQVEKQKTLPATYGSEGACLIVKSLLPNSAAG